MPGQAYLEDLPSQPQVADQAPAASLLDPFSGQSIGKRLIFQYPPAELKRGTGCTWNGQVVPGHSHRRLQYGGGGARTWKFMLEFYLDSDDTETVKRQMEWLESATFASYDGSGNLVQAPRHLKFVWGSLVYAEVVVMPFEYTYGPFWDTEKLLPKYAKADMTLEEVSLVAVSADQWRSNGAAGLLRGGGR